MRRLAHDAYGKLILAGGFERRRSCVSVCVERIAKIGGEKRGIETARAVDAALLGNGKYNLEVAVWDVMLLQAAQRLKDGNHPRLVVCA